MARDPSKDRRLARNGGVLVLGAAALIAFIGDWESARNKDGSTNATVYADRLAKGLPTAGCYGITKHVTSEPVIVGDVWSHEQCERVLGEALKNPQYSILNCVTYAGLTQNTFDALSSFAWNVGATAACGSRAVGLINQGRIVEGCNALSRTPDGKPNWSYAGGTFVQGLYSRRLAETNLCMSEKPASVKPALGGHVGVVRQLGVVEVAEMLQPPLHLDARDPLLRAYVPGDAKQTAGFVVGVGQLPVLGVDAVGPVAQVIDPVVGLHSISVVDFKWWPLAVHVEPRKPVGKVPLAIESDLQVARTASRGDAATGSAMLRAPSRFDPTEDARYRVVVKQLKKPRMGQVDVFHEAHYETSCA